MHNKFKAVYIVVPAILVLAGLIALYLLFQSGFFYKRLMSAR
jgi:hypothetical protein